MYVCMYFQQVSELKILYLMKLQHLEKYRILDAFFACGFLLLTGKANLNINTYIHSFIDMYSQILLLFNSI